MYINILVYIYIYLARTKKQGVFFIVLFGDRDWGQKRNTTMSNYETYYAVVCTHVKQTIKKLGRIVHHNENKTIKKL